MIENEEIKTRNGAKGTKVLVALLKLLYQITTFEKGKDYIQETERVFDILIMCKNFFFNIFRNKY